jgi:hypothetical protein
MSRYPRKILSSVYTAPTTSTAVGVYNIVEQFQAKTGNNWPLLAFTGGDQTVADLKSLGDLMTFGATETPTSGGTLTVNSVALGSYDYIIKNSSTTISSFSNSDWFTNTEDTRSAVITINGNLTINGGITFAPTYRKLFTFIYVTGNFTHSGTISMTDKGANHSGSGNSGGSTTAGNILIYSGTHGGVSNPQIPASGGAGAGGQSAGCPGSPSNPAGTSGSAGGTGGGGGGGNCGGGGGSGATGTSFVGGGGGGGMNDGGSGATGGSAVANGGRGGDAGPSVGGGAAGGTGQPGGSFSTGGSNGNTGLPGVVIIICAGTISGSGSITSIGQIGGAGGHASGGSAGGGSINVLYGTNSSSWSLDASGGAYNNTNPYNRNGGAGGTGTARMLSI